jgi:hypothetical protein
MVLGKSILQLKTWRAIMASRALKIDPKKATTSDPDFQPGRSEPIEERAVAARAYECWQERGCPIGSDQEDWFRAEKELKKQAKIQTAA